MFFYEGIKLYNELPKEIRDKPSLCSFKNECKKFIIENYEMLYKNLLYIQKELTLNK